MNDFFGTIYDGIFNIYHESFHQIFQHLFDNGGYVKMGMAFLIIPLAGWLLFYYIWKHPYSRVWHWLIWLALIVLIVFITTHGIAGNEIFDSDNQALNELIADTETGYGDYADSLPLKYAFANSLLALIVSIIYSLIMKQFSKIHIHLPL